MNNITTDLEYLVNPSIFEKIITQNKSNINKTEQKFYKRRVLQLAKNLYKNPEEYPSSLQNSFRDFLSTSIAFLKFEDKKEFMQEEYKDYIEKPNTSSLKLNKNVDNLVCNHPVKTIKDFLTVRPAPVKIHLPEKKEFNEQDPKFKMKGVKKKMSLNNNEDQEKKV